MSDGGLGITFYARAEALLKDMEKLAKKQEDSIAKFDEMGKRARKGGDDAAKGVQTAEKELEKFAAATMKVNRTPLERYREEMFKLNAALKMGKIDQESYNRAVANAKTQLDQAGQSGKQAFGAAALSALTQYALGMVSVSSAVQFISAAMNYAKQSTDGAMQSVERLIETRRELQQMADTGAEFQQFDEFANRLSMRGLTRGGAQQIISAAQAEGFQGNEDLVARLVAANELTPTSVRTLAGQIPSIFDRKITPMQGIAGGALAGKFSRLTVDELANMLPKAAQGGAISGASPAETMALGATLVTRGERAPEYMGTFASQLATGEYRKQFAGIGVIGAVEKLQAMTEGQRQKILGTGKETNLTYQWVLKDMPLIKERTAAIQEAFDNAESYVARVEAKAFDPATSKGRLMQARRESIVEANRLEIQREEELAGGGYLRRAAALRAEAANERSRLQGPVSRYIGYKATQWAEGAKLPPAVVESAGMAGKATLLTVLESVMPPALKSSTELYNNLTRASESLDRAAANLERETSNVNRQRAAVAGQPE